MNLFTRFFCWPGARTSAASASASVDATASAKALIAAAPRETNRERAEAAILKLQQEVAMFDARITNVDNEVAALDAQIRAALKEKNVERAKRLLRKRKMRKAQGENFFQMQCNIESMLCSTQGMNIKMDLLETFDMVARVKDTDNSKVEELMTLLSEKINNGDELSQILNQPLQTDLLGAQDDAALLEELAREYGYGLVDSDSGVAIDAAVVDDNDDNHNDTVPQRDMSLRPRRRENAPRAPQPGAAAFAAAAGGLGARQPDVEAKGGKVLLHE
jgi:hypothetical protein